MKFSGKNECQDSASYCILSFLLANSVSWGVEEMCSYLCPFPSGKMKKNGLGEPLCYQCSSSPISPSSLREIGSHKELLAPIHSWGLEVGVSRILTVETD